ncbi:MAG: hypothetical protein LBF83_10100 [Spirochaetaceae bacterium]|nr:hypothetical protein [Spirochaetaceae bacterium]
MTGSRPASRKGAASNSIAVSKRELSEESPPQRKRALPSGADSDQMPD